MITTELIKKLQQMVDNHKCMEEVMGPHEIVIDVFEKDLDNPHKFRYVGFSSQIVFDKSSDGVYDILSAFAEDRKKEL